MPQELERVRDCFCRTARKRQKGGDRRTRRQREREEVKDYLLTNYIYKVTQANLAYLVKQMEYYTIKGGGRDRVRRDKAKEKKRDKAKEKKRDSKRERGRERNQGSHFCPRILFHNLLSIFQTKQGIFFRKIIIPDKNCSCYKNITDFFFKVQKK